MADINVMDKVPEKVIIPLRQHNGTDCDQLVKKGDHVLVGQKIGECSSDDCACVHSSVCGEVVSIEDAPNSRGNEVKSVIIEAAEAGTCVDFVPTEDLVDVDLIKVIKDAGIVEHYGVPTHRVLSTEGENIDTVIIDATSSEWIGGHFDTSVQYGTRMLESLRLLMKAAEASKGAIVLRNDDRDSINIFDGLEYEGKRINVGPLVGNRHIGYYLKDQGSDMVVVSHDRIYGKDKLSLFTHHVTGRKVPFHCAPADVGVAICSIKSAKALYDILHEGKPYIETVVSVSGMVKNPQRILVKIGTTFRDVIEACGGYVGEPAKLIADGAITGVAQYTDQVPVTKVTTAITVQGPGEVSHDDVLACIHCARCVDVCPVELVPNRLAALADQGRFDECRQMNIGNCIECGKCAAVCPSKIHILQLIRYSKESINRAYEDIAPKESSNLKIGCSCGSV